MTVSTRTAHSGFWQRWLARRLPAAREHTLTHKGIFILPTGFGVFWLLLVLLLFLFGTNYQNNLVIGLAMLMASIFNTCLIFGYRNLAGLTIKGHWPAQVYAGETLAMPIQLESSHACWQVGLNYPKNRIAEITRITDSAVEVLVPVRHTQRGRMNLGRVRISSCYPMGLCRAWSHLDMAMSPLVFAKPEKPDDKRSYMDFHGNDDVNGGNQLNGVDEFSGLRDYIRGESLKQVAWKQLAQGRGMLTKQFEQPQGEAIWLVLPGADTDLEKRLSALSYLVEYFSRDQHLFGLELNGEQVAPGAGESHRLACQEAIALYGEHA
ncbi:DUF58 domain-containing protein [Shewanella submarina]|uniref:DUF58 domain-containing protein n=1 Tax=Shewanella submarina TaxID=2016376 RepID=A0ABV7GDA3_9GAMM|nr:DUF58 domain-containing protein [Shewanella submarina]MCL1039178.1 DUF58 domain-containing protein [Shewanella submarina]